MGANKQGMKESRQRIFYGFFALGVKFTQGIKVKKLIYIAIFLQLSISSLLLADVYFADPNLETAVADALGLEPPITEGQMVNLHSLTANNLGIWDLTGLEYATDVNELHLSGNLISDLSPISTLTSLIYLYLNDNQITDISAVSSLVNLDILFLSINDVNDISPVSGLTGLTSLYLGSNQISGDDILSLSELSNLTTLDLTNNDVNDISTIVENLTSLEHLYLANNQVVDLPDMSNLTSLQSLHLTDNFIEDISGLTGEEPNDLSSLLLSGNLLDKISYCTYLNVIANNNPLLSLGDIEVDDYPLDENGDPTTCIDHDVCDDAIEIFKNVIVDANSFGATGPEEESGCGVDDWLDVWHSYTPVSDEVVNIDLCGSSLDTSLVVFDSCPDTGGTVLACNDDYNGLGYDDLDCGVQSLVTVELTGGQTYMIRVAGYSAPTNGTGVYQLIIEDAPDPPVNNTCEDAIEVVQYSPPITGSTILAYGTDITSCTASDTRDVWYYFNPTISGLYLIDPDPNSTGDYESTLAVFDDCGGTELVCNDLYCNYNRWGYCDVYKSRIIVSLVVRAEPYYIRVSGYAGKGGDYSLTVTLAPDINKDGVVDILDLSLVVDEWMEYIDDDKILRTSYADIGPEEADGGGDKFIDMLDFAALGKQWRATPNP